MAHHTHRGRTVLRPWMGDETGRGDPTRRRQTWSGRGVRSTPIIHMPLPYDVTIIIIISSVHWIVRVDFHASGQALLEENDVAL